jgi:hypothetical protein
MGLHPHRRNLVVVRQSAGSAGRHGAPRFIRLARTSRFRRWIRTGKLLCLVGLIHLARAGRPRWRPLLAGGVLTAAGFMMRGGSGGMVLLPGLMFLVYAALIPASTKAERIRRVRLERELAGYSTPAQRRDFEATLDRYPDRITREIRDILAQQAMAAGNHGIPGTG